jgi:hypothetical protein
VASRPARVFFNGEKGDSNGYQSMSKSIMQNDKNGHQSVHRLRPTLVVIEPREQG